MPNSFQGTSRLRVGLGWRPVGGGAAKAGDGPRGLPRAERWGSGPCRPAQPFLGGWHSLACSGQYCSHLTDGEIEVRKASGLSAGHILGKETNPKVLSLA